MGNGRWPATGSSGKAEKSARAVAGMDIGGLTAALPVKRVAPKSNPVML